VSRGADLATAVQAWVDVSWDQSLTIREWWCRLAEAGYAYPGWPVGVGGSGMSSADTRVVMGILARNGVVGPPVGHVAANLAAPTLLKHGTDDQIAEHVRSIALGESAWCQLFSEPGSGSDLASVGTRAIRDGDQWVVTGQKVWNSGADSADFGMLLARTDPDQPKHRGITYFVIDMHQPGVEVRPLRQMNGMSSFCEVFLNDARVPVDQVLGELNDGWHVAQTTLAHERNSVAGGGATGLVIARSGRGGDLECTVGQVIERMASAAKTRQRRIRGGAVPSKTMIHLANTYRMTSDPVLRQDLARYVAQVRVNGWTMRRIAAAGGRLTGADGSIAKLSTSRICQQSRDLSYRIVGADGLLCGPESALDGDLQMVGLASPGTRIGGGTDEIQLNVLGERGLGLPREPNDDRTILYRDLKVGTQR
jgi:alkylation response protein AidB-like acyl-CoA dehydrogenase